MNTGGHNREPKNMKEVWTSAWQHAQRDKRIWDDVERARALDPEQASESDFLRECAWAIFGAGFSYVALAQLWPSLQEALVHFNVDDIMAQEKKVRADALRVLNHSRKVDAVLWIANWLHERDWSQVLNEMLSLCKKDMCGNLVVTKPLLDWLDELPWVGQTLAKYICKDIGIGAVKDDRVMRRLARFLGYTPDPDGVWKMALGVQTMVRKEYSVCEKLNVIDTVLWNWARLQPWLRDE